VVDANAESIAIHEARKLEIPVIAIVDTNSNPEGVDIVIPGNDDSVRGLQIVLKSLADACVEGKKLKDSGQGMEAKFNIRAFDEAPAQRQEKGRGRRPQRGARTRHGGKSAQGRAEHRAKVDATAEEAVKQAETQAKEDKAPTVRKKPAAKKPDAAPAAAPAPETPAAPKPDAPAEAPKAE
jgi:small subunit ribosomal protein S2